LAQLPCKALPSNGRVTIEDTIGMLIATKTRIVCNEAFFMRTWVGFFLKTTQNTVISALKIYWLISGLFGRINTIALIGGFLVPALVGLAFGSPWGGLLYGCIARVVITHHGTFFINSLCHIWGHQPYSDKNSAKDNFLLAFFTYGEGYHNFHHRFEADYRNGIRWYHWDPTKWLIRSMAFVGMTRNLRRVPETEILKARLLADEARLMKSGYYNERIQQLRAQIEETQKKIAQYHERYKVLKRDFSQQKREAMVQVQAEIKFAKIELRARLNQWQILCRYQLSPQQA
jgi:stearoyl-CoA desaturase (Delta-9 desaturase)